MVGRLKRLSGNCRDFSTFRRKKRVLVRNTPIYGGYHGNSQRSVKKFAGWKVKNYTFQPANMPT
jgi:hypothetical protein